MLEIKKRNGFYEAMLNGGMLAYSEDLSDLLKELSKYIDDIEESLSDS